MIWIDLRHAIEKQGKKFDTMEVEIYSHSRNRIQDIFLFKLKCVMHIYREEHFYTGVCKVCPSFVSYWKQCELPCCYFQRWANPLVVASLETWIHEIKGIWFFATIGFNSIITLMFIQVSYLKWVGLWCLDMTLILPNSLINAFISI